MFAQKIRQFEIFFSLQDFCFNIISCLCSIFWNLSFLNCSSFLYYVLTVSLWQYFPVDFVLLFQISFLLLFIMFFGQKFDFLRPHFFFLQSFIDFYYIGNYCLDKFQSFFGHQSMIYFFSLFAWELFSICFQNSYLLFNHLKSVSVFKAYKSSFNHQSKIFDLKRLFYLSSSKFEGLERPD